MSRLFSCRAGNETKGSLLPGSSYLHPILSEFRDPAREELFRLWHLSQARRRGILSLLLVLAAFVIYTPANLIAPSTYPPGQMGGLRIATTVACLVLLTLIARTRSPQLLRRALFGWSLAFAIGNVSAVWSFAGDYRQVVGNDILVVLYLYAVVPNRLPLQLLPALVVTLGNGVFLLSARPLPGEMWVQGAGLLMANVMGFATSWSMNRVWRHNHAAYQKEHETRLALEDALGEVQRLRGILPICSECHKIRVDDGEWQRIDDYMAERAGAEFSHGICPDCLVGMQQAEPS